MERAAYQKDLLTKRWRKVRPPEVTEYQLQVSVWKQFSWRKREGVTGFHCPNGGLRDIRVASKLKLMGVLPGVPDLMFIWGELVAAPTLLIMPRILFLELKRRGGKLSPEQVAFKADMERKGCLYEMADNIDAAMAVLEKHGLLKPSRSSTSAPAASGVHSDTG